MTRLLALLAVFALLPVVARGEGYVCVEDMVTGFRYADGSWHSADFQPGEKFIVRAPTQIDQGYLDDVIKLPNAKNLKWVVSKTGTAVPIFACTGDFSELGNLLCPPVAVGPSDRYDLSALKSPSDFRMNKNTLRFLFAHLTGYWADRPDREGRDSPLIAIGKCTPM
jgi:hypothetical protein